MTPNKETIRGLIQLLEDFIDGTNRSMQHAGKIEVELDDAFPDDPRFEDLILSLASYRPGGGEYLYDEETIGRMCVQAAAILRTLL